MFSLYKTHSKVSHFCYLEPGVYPSITDIVEAMNNLIQQICNHSKAVSQLKCLEERKS